MGDINSAIRVLESSAVDSKFSRLEEVISGVFEQEIAPEFKKVIVFCSFHATISYLMLKLTAHYPSAFVQSITGNDDIEQRKEKAQLFKKTRSNSILLCTEIVGEGLDFQFCRYLVNYDMPWNPAKLEQRVGRIDRIGQEAEKIKIFNLVNKSTIEDHIMSKLFERVKVFSCTLGPLGDLLSKYQKEFRSHILETNRSAEEKEKYEKRILENITLKNDEQQEFEKSQYQIFGALQFFSDDAAVKDRVLSDKEVKSFWNVAVLECCPKFNQVEVKTDVYKISLSENSLSFVSDCLSNCSDLNNNRKKKDYFYSTIINNLKNDALLLTFDQEIAINNHHIEYITLSHPLFKGLMEILLREYHKDKQIYHFACKMPFLADGEYLVFFYKFTFTTKTAGLTDQVEEGILTFNIETAEASWIEDRSFFVQCILETGVKSPNNNNYSISREVRNLLDSEKQKYAESLVEKFKVRVLQDRLAKTSVITNSYADQMRQVKMHLKNIHAPNVRRNYETQLTNLEREMNEKINHLDQGEIRSVIKCSSVLHLIVS